MRRAAPITIALVLLACATPRRTSAPAPTREELLRTAHPQLAVKMIQSVTIVTREGPLPLVGYMMYEPPEHFRVYAMDPTGMKVLDVAGEHDMVGVTYEAPPLKKQNAGRAVAKDIRRMFCRRPGTDWTYTPGKREHTIQRGNERFVYGHTPVRLTRYEGEGFTVRYTEWLEVEGRLYPSRVVLEDTTQGYEVRVQVKEIEEIVDPCPCLFEAKVWYNEP